MKVEYIYKSPWSLQIAGTMGFPSEPALEPRSATIVGTVMDPVTFARATHEFKLTITDPSAAPAPKLKLRDITPTHRDDAKKYVVGIENSYDPNDYSIAVTYNGQPMDDLTGSTIAPDVSLVLSTGRGSGYSELQSQSEYLVAFNLYDYRPSGSGKPSAPEAAEVTITYKPSGKSTTVKVKIPELKDR